VRLTSSAFAKPWRARWTRSLEGLYIFSLLCMCALLVFLACSWQHYSAIYCPLGLDVLEQFKDMPNHWQILSDRCHVVFEG
jgi:hypothetical protein